jgi:phytoene dehydrogenase-like protein
VFLELLDAGAVPDGVRTATGAWRLDSVGSFIAHFGIRGEPPRGAAGDAGDALIQVIGFEDEDAVAEHLDHTAHGRLPDTPAGYLTVTSRHDPSQAAPGPYGPLHTMRFETIAPPVRADGQWTRERTAAYRSACLDLLRATTTGLDAARVLTAFSDSPHDLERRFRTVRNGSVRQGRITRSQSFSARPHPDCSGGRTPIQLLYLAGGGVHPGVPGSLGGGYNAAAAVCEDLPDLVRWWPEPAFVQQARDARLMPERAAAGASRGFRHD